MIKYEHKDKGFALLLAVIVSSIAMSVGMSMLNITLKQIALGTTTLNSEVSFQVASAGQECLIYLRNHFDAEVTQGNPINSSCLAESISMTDDMPIDAEEHHFNQQIEWTTVDGLYCLDLDIRMLVPVGAAKSITFAGKTTTCADGDVCGYGVSRGYNVSCSALSSSIQVLQRELSIEF